MPKRPRAKPTRRAPNYDRKLTRRIVLHDGTRLVTLRDAANLFAKRFATVKRSRLLELAIERLIAAAENSKRDAVKAATDSIERVLRTRRLPRPADPRNHRIVRFRPAARSRSGAGRASLKTCVWRWQERFAEEGVDGLLRHKTRPAGGAGRPGVIDRVVALTATEAAARGDPWT